MSYTHATTLISTDGEQSSELRDTFNPIPARIKHSLSLLGDDNWYAYSLWKLPVGVEFPDVDLEKWPVEYLQSAGSAAGMSIEIRRLEADGEPHQYAVAKGSARSGEPARRLSYSDQYLDVHENEVFTAEEAAPIYIHYFETGELPAGVGLRDLDL